MVDEVTVNGLSEFLNEPIPQAEWDRMRLEEARREDARIRTHPHAQPTEFVAGNFKRRWSGGNIEPDKRFGSDYDYWGAVVEEAINLWNQYASGLVAGYHDYIAEGKHGWPKHFSLDAYRSAGVEVWDNGTRTSPGATLKGPVDIGPTADFAIFLEIPGAHFRVFRGIGVVRAVADTLDARWRHAHRVFFATTKKSGRVYPFVRIRNRHARG